MLQYNDSDMFTFMNKGDGIQIALKKALQSITPDLVMNDKIENNLATLRKVYKESIIVKIISGIEKGEIILVNFNPLTCFPAYMPYVKAKLKGRECVIIDVSKFTTVQKDNLDNITGYNLDVSKLYNVIVPAYISLKLFGKTDALPYTTTVSLAEMWARMFCNTLMNNTIGILQNHAERYQAFMYFSIKFFCLYYLQTPPATATKASMAFIDNSKSSYISYVEDRLETMNIDMYKDFTTFCLTLFNDEVTNIRGIGNKVNDMNQSRLLMLYKNQYSMNAIMGLCAPDYFLLILFNAFNKSNYVRDRGFEIVIDGVRGEHKREVPKLLSEIYKEV